MLQSMRSCDRNYAAIHIGINQLLKGTPVASVEIVCNDILDIALRCRNHNTGTFFISSVAYSTIVVN